MEKCNEQQLEAFIDSQLSEEEQSNAMRHLEECIHCSEKLAQLQLAQNAIRLAATLRIVPQNAASLTQAIMTEVQGKSQKNGVLAVFMSQIAAFIAPFNALRTGFALASLALVLLFAQQQYTFFKDTTSSPSNVSPLSLKNTEKSGAMQSDIIHTQVSSQLRINTIKMQVKRGLWDDQDVKNIAARIEALEMEKSELKKLLQNNPDLAASVAQYLTTDEN